MEKVWRFDRFNMKNIYLARGKHFRFNFWGDFLLKLFFLTLRIDSFRNWFLKPRFKLLYSCTQAKRHGSEIWDFVECNFCHFKYKFVICGKKKTWASTIIWVFLSEEFPLTFQKTFLQSKWFIKWVVDVSSFCLKSWFIKNESIAQQLQMNI